MISLLQYFSDLFPIALFLVLLNRVKHEKVLWVIFLYSIYSFVNNNLLLYVFRHNDSQGYLSMSLFTAVEFVSFVIIFLLLLKNRYLLTVVKVVSLAFLVFCVFSIIGSNHQAQFDSLQSSLSSLLIIIFCIFYFFERLNEPQMNYIYSDFHFWIVLSLLIYVAATLFLFLYVVSLPHEIADEYWAINNYSNIIKNILFSIAIIKSAQTPNFPKPKNTLLQSDF